MNNRRFTAVLLIFATGLMSCLETTPNILIIGDSISIGYTPYVKSYFKDNAVVMHNEGNAQHTGTGLMKLEKWLGDKHWDVIQFNWGLWDLCYRNPESKTGGNRDKINGKVTYTPEAYAANLDSLVTMLKRKTDAKLIFVTTTYVPEDEQGRFTQDVMRYNEAAKKIMKKHSIVVNDIYKKSIRIHKQFGKGSADVHYTDEGYKELSKLIANFLSAEVRTLKGK